jgi:hypothetical protein
MYFLELNKYLISDLCCTIESYLLNCGNLSEFDFKVIDMNVNRLNWKKISIKSIFKQNPGFITKYFNCIKWKYVNKTKLLNHDVCDIEFIIKLRDLIEWRRSDLKFICETENITLDFLRAFKNDEYLEHQCIYKSKLDWELISKNIILWQNVNNIKEFIHYLNWKNIFTYSDLSENCLEYVYSKKGEQIFSLFTHKQYSKLSHDFIDKHNKYLNWEILTKIKVKDLNFIDKYKEYVNWEFLTYETIYDLHFIEKYKEYIDWSISVSYYIKYPDILCKYKKYISKLLVNDEIYYMYCNKLDILENILDNVDYKKVSEYLVKMYKRYMEYTITNKKYIQKLDWDILSSNDKLTKKTLELYIDHWNWSIISKCETFNSQLIVKYADKLDWTIIPKRYKLHIKIIQKIKDKINWKDISKRQILNFNFLNKFANYMDWDYISQYWHMNLFFIYEFKVYLNLKLLNINKHVDPILKIKVKCIMNDKTD